MRLKNIELSYSLPQSWIKKAAMKECRIYVNASNLVTWDRLGGLTDPESNGSKPLSNYENRKLWCKYSILKNISMKINRTLIYTLLAATLSGTSLTSCEEMFGDFLDKQPSNELTEEEPSVYGRTWKSFI